MKPLDASSRTEVLPSATAEQMARRRGGCAGSAMRADDLLGGPARVPIGEREMRLCE
jgi:hypothetical protein